MPCWIQAPTAAVLVNTPACSNDQQSTLTSQAQLTRMQAAVCTRTAPTHQPNYTRSTQMGSALQLHGQPCGHVCILYNLLGVSMSHPSVLPQLVMPICNSEVHHITQLGKQKAATQKTLPAMQLGRACKLLVRTSRASSPTPMLHTRLHIFVRLAPFNNEGTTAISLASGPYFAADSCSSSGPRHG